MSVEPTGFHAHSGWYFRREPNGSVRIERRPASARGATVGVTLDADTWASVVASVSAAGEDGTTFRQALTFHGVPE